MPIEKKLNKEPPETYNMYMNSISNQNNKAEIIILTMNNKR